ncbi:MAG: ACP S-malonyltransferase [Desulfonatronovibrio sp.]
MPSKRSAILFPGQGSQEKGMGRDLAEKQSQSMDIWKMAEKISGHPLREIFWDGTPKDMSRTEYLQPALTVASLNLWFFFKDSLSVQAVAGHSLGEYCALCASKVLGLEQTLKLVSLRGRLMAESGRDSSGAMAAILKLDQSRVEQLCSNQGRNTDQVLVIANYNTPRQFVVSGELEAVQAMEPLVSDARGRFVRLPVSGAFHTPLMEEAARELAGMMNKMDWKIPDCDIYFNSTAAREKNPEKIKKLMQKQMISPVYFIQLIENMEENRVKQYIEIGPKGVLSRMVPQILGPEKDAAAINLSNPDDGDKLISTEQQDA